MSLQRHVLQAFVILVLAKAKANSVTTLVSLLATAFLALLVTSAKDFSARQVCQDALSQSTSSKECNHSAMASRNIWKWKVGQGTDD
jgi:hypothetical protein